MRNTILESKRIIDGPPILMPFADDKYWMTLRRIKWKGDFSGREVTIPPYFVTDFASVPFLFRGVVPRWGKHGRAAIIHDYLYWEQKWNWEQNWKRKEADNVLTEVMKEYKVFFLARAIIYFGVRVGGCWAWCSNKRAKRNGKVRVFSKDQLPNEMETFKEFEKRLQETEKTKK